LAMKNIVQYIVTHTFKPLLTKYLSKTRVYSFAGIKLDIATEVFHPGFFFSTKLLLKYLQNLYLPGRQFLELGCGSGLISIVAARHGAEVMATDINPVAISFLKKNSMKNGVKLQIIQSDLFNDIPITKFDIIAINPPYYKKKPLTAKDYAWFCGENGEYFANLFQSLPQFVHKDSEILMVLYKGCDMEMIRGYASKNNFCLRCILTRQNLLEKNFIYKIEKCR
jgi:release factor glutamine methyltransferase